MLSTLDLMKGPFRSPTADVLARLSLFGDAASPVEAAPRPAAAATAQTVLATSVRHPAVLLSDRAGFYDHFTMSAALGRGALVAFNVAVPRLVTQMKELPQDDQQQMEHIIETGDFPDWNKLAVGFKVLWMREFARNMAITTMARILESAIIANTDLVKADMFMRNLSRAAKKEHEVTGSLADTVVEITKLAACTWLVSTTASFIVNESFTVGDVIYEAVKSTQDFLEYVKGCGQRLLAETGRNLKVSFVTYVACVTGSIAGTILWPGFGTFLGSQIATIVADNSIL